MPWNDLRQAARSLWHAPLFTLVTAATLALGIGATAAIFTVVHGVLLEPLPYPEADRILAVTTRWTSGRQSPRVTGGDFVDIRQAAPAFEALAYYYGGEVGVQLPGHADFTPVYWTTADLFRVFGAAPLGGRVFDDAQIEAVVSEEFAVRHFENATAALGQHLSVEGCAYPIVGVLPPSFHFPPRAEVWLPAGITPSNLNRTAFNYQAVGRMREGVSLERAQVDLETVASRLARAYPDSNGQKTFAALPLRELLVGAVRPTLRLIFGAVLLVLLIACANTASLLLARAASRGQEIAVRVSLGATLWRLLRQFLAESLLLALLGGAAGVGLAVAATSALLRLAPPDLPRMDNLHVAWPVIAFTAAVSIATSILFGIAPVLQARLVDPRRALGQGNRAIGERGLHRMRSALLAGEIALAFALTVSAGLLVRSLRALDAVPLGYETDHRLVLYAHAPARSRDEHVQVTRSFDRLLDEIGHVPGVLSAAAVMGLPGGQYGSNGAYAVEGRHVFAPGQDLPEADFALASGGYFAAMGIPLIGGRDFEGQDQDGAPAVAIVSEALARESFPGEDPIGRRITCGLDEPKPMTIVGVVGDVRRRSPAVPPGPLLYMPLAQHPYYANEVQIVVQTALRPEAASETLRRMVRAHSPEIAMRFTTLERTLSDSVSTPRFRTALFVAFGALALALAMAGVYGLMSYIGALRTAEFGVRMALGGRPADVVRLMLSHAARVAGVGLAVGVAAAVAIAHLTASLLFEVKALDPAAFVAAAAALLMMTLAGAALPAWRASRVDPVRAIRME